MPRELILHDRPTATPSTRLAAKGAPPPGGKVRSKREQRYAFASRQPWAHTAAKRGQAFTALPERKRTAR